MDWANLNISFLELILGGFIIFCLVSAFRMNRNKESPFDILDLLMENNHVSKAAVVMMGSFSLTTWLMVFLTLNEKLTEGYLAIYVGAWITPVVVRLIASPVTHKTPEKKVDSTE